MKTNELNKIMKKLSLPSYLKKGRLAYSIIEHKSGAKLLKGFYLDSSTDNHSFFLQYFVQTLYDPFPTFDFSLGDRIGGHLTSTDIDEINMMLNSFKEFDFLTSFSDYIPYLESHPYHGAEINRLKCYAFHYYLEGNYDKSKFYFLKILDIDNSKNVNWVNDIIDVAKEFVSFIDSGNYIKGIENLLQWQHKTIASLRLS